MARAKRTERAEVRRRNRVLQAEAAALPAPSPAAPAQSAAPPTSMVETVRRMLGQAHPPDFGADAHALPGIVRGTPWILVPYGLLVLGAALAAVLPKNGASGGSIPSFYVQLAFLQPTLLFFLAGFLAPRAAYLFGALLGILASLLFVVLAVGLVGVFGALDKMSFGDRLVYSGWQLVQFTLTGAVFGWFASWYRDFLRRSQARSRQTAEARKREQRRQARRPESKRAR
ncbi:MAG: hypothetical protein ACP5VP_00420 [Candidatus Limnocylindrales bacterium]